MHRSGTSLVAGLLQAAGVDFGISIPARPANPRGFFEDRELMQLGRRMMAAAAGQPDWGWSEDGELDRERFADFTADARALLARRASASRRWGWKDPRVSLALDFWHSLLPEATFVLLYRLPWLVIDSLQRVGREEFLRQPSMGRRLWSFYQQALLDFCRRHPRSVVLVSVDALLAAPARTLPRLAERLQLPLDERRLATVREPALFRRTAADDPLVSLFAATYPEEVALLRALDAAAFLPGTDLWQPRPLAELGAARDPDPAVSVVIPCRDHGEVLVEALASCHRCVPRPMEVVIVDDGSTEPRTLDVLATLDAAGYHVVRQQHAGLSAARNRGIAAARADLILPLDADNRLLPGFVERAVARLASHPEVGAVYADRRDFGLHNRSVKVPPFDLDRLAAVNFIDACALLRRQLWSDCGGYDERLPIWEDWDLWLGAAERGWRLDKVPGEACEYRVRPDSLIRSYRDPERRAELRRYLRGKHDELYRRRSPPMAADPRPVADPQPVPAPQPTAEPRPVAQMPVVLLDWQHWLDDGRRAIRGRVDGDVAGAAVSLCGAGRELARAAVADDGSFDLAAPADEVPAGAVLRLECRPPYAGLRISGGCLDGEERHDRLRVHGSSFDRRRVVAKNGGPAAPRAAPAAVVLCTRGTPAPLPRVRRVIVLDAGAAPTQAISVRPPLAMLQAEGRIAVTIVKDAGGVSCRGLRQLRAGAGDALVVTRYVSAACLDVVRAWKGRCPIVYLVDDDLPAAADTGALTPGYRRAMESATFGLAAMLELCERLVVSSPALERRFRSPKTLLLEPSFVRSPRGMTHHDGRSPIRVAYHGTGVHAEDLAMIAGPLRRLAASGDGVEVEVVSPSVPRELVGAQGVRVHGQMPWDRYCAYVAANPAHLLLVPLRPTPFNRGKATIKFFDAASLGAAGIFSNVEPYDGLVRSGVDGVLVENDPEAWFAAASSLVRRRDEIARLAHAAQATAKERGAPSLARDFWAGLLGV